MESKTTTANDTWVWAAIVMLLIAVLWPKFGLYLVWLVDEMTNYLVGWF